MGDDLHDQARKIATEGGDYKERGQHVAVNVGTPHDTQTGKEAKENRAVMDALLLMQGKRLDAQEIANLQSRYSEHGDAIARAVRIMTVRTMNDLQDAVDTLSACVKQLVAANEQRDEASEEQERKQDRRINILIMAVVGELFLLLLIAFVLWRMGGI